MKNLKVTIVIIDQVDEGFDKHLINGEPWAFKEYERRLAARLGVTNVVVVDIKDKEN